MFEQPKFKIIYSEEVLDFLNSLNEKVKEKIKFRTKYSGSIYRIFAFWDTENDTLVVTTHGIIKKTQKTPSKEIKRAEDIRIEYFNTKNRK